jgi:purine-binding chemotaxis protein CheW
MTSTQMASQQYVTFQLDRELFGVAVARTREILSLVQVTGVPQMPDYMQGVINLRGQVVPVVDLRVKLGMARAASTRDSCIIVMDVQVDDEMLTIGGLADSVREVLELSDEKIEPPPRMGTKLKTEFIAGMGRLDEEFLILLDIDRVFCGEELDAIQESAATPPMTN